MKNTLIHFLAISSMALGFSCSTSRSETPVSSQSQSTTLQVDASKVIAPIQPTMYGIFFEDINFAADGGLYAEMVKNRSFEFELLMTGWSQPKSDKFSMNDDSGFALIIKDSGEEPNSHFLRITTKATQGYQLVNEGFRGMGVKNQLTYNLSILSRQIEGTTKLTFELIDPSGKSLGSTSIQPDSKDWKAYTASFSANGTQMNAQLQISVEGTGVVDLDMVSLFPSDTWKNRPKGLRADLVQLLADLNPGFLRFPGGCIVEGRTLARRYQWKKTVGDIKDRELLVNRWNTEFTHRPAPDYYQSFGLGFFEYFQLAEDLGAEPLPILSCGIACQFNTGELVPMEDLDPYVEDALDLIEFANGPITSSWGKLRDEMGHPEPFNMKMIGVGNEQWGPEYIKRYKVFEAAIKAKYPEMTIVSGSGPFPEGEMFDYGMEELKKLNAEIVDEHYYSSPEWFLKHADRYDAYDRKGPKIFAGEYAAQSVAIASPDNKNNWECALSEAAFMTGLERNADIVYMTSYAPLLAHAEGWQWTPDLIWFNNLEANPTANYFVQKLYATNKGTDLISVTDNNEVVKGQTGLYASAVIDSKTSELIVKLVNSTEAAKPVNLNVSGSRLKSDGVMTILKNTDLKAENSFDQKQVTPSSANMKTVENTIAVTLEPYSFYVIRVGIEQQVN
jgi:alpha-L-arabinofuranosidase